VPLPADFDRGLWLDPMTFQGLVGAVLASSKVEYRELFRADGFAKPQAELRQNRHIAKILERL
jgi:hypothetical protein